ncbi:la-related protein 6a [Paramormyrops kingsleyae]|uniref:La ribonucleoprotein 6, translational regulator a n=1 Tax=Paramormyrops kingsleyae TaxID=1676925 RepID=A0A3B3Q9I4_9TELE|nr:la-related protein 6 [Paramormyrops kingsleyae]
MHALICVFLRCLSLLAPSPWWRGDECGGAAWPNPRARFKGKKPLTHQEVSAQDTSLPFASAAPSLVSPAAGPASPRGSPWGRIWELWRAAERVLVVPVHLYRRRCRKGRSADTPYPPVRNSAADGGGIGRSAAVATGSERSAREEEADRAAAQALTAGSMSAIAAAAAIPDCAEPTPDAGDRNVSTDSQLQEMGTRVRITVAIQAAEDEDPGEDAQTNHLDLAGGSCSEDDFGRSDKHGGVGTSGGEMEEEEEEEESWVPPDAELMQKLVAQIEYYLSDENLEHDAFLLKHVRRNKLGYVSVKLLTSFKKVKHLTRDWRTTAHALRQSALLELNEEGRKVRRRSAVPVFASESLPSRMLLLNDLRRWPELGTALMGGEGGMANGGGGGAEGGGTTQQEHPMEVLLRAFGTYGPIASVRVLKPGKDLAPDLKKLSGRYTQLGTEECAIVEFEEVEAAIRAHEAVGGGSLGVKVVLIGTKPPKKKVTKERQRDEGSAAKNRSLNSRVRELQYQGDDSACSSSETESNPTSPRLARKARSGNKLSPTGGSGYQQNHLSPTASPRTSPWSSPRASPCSQRRALCTNKSPLAAEGRLSPDSGRRWADYSSDSSVTPSGSPWVQRRRQVASQENSPSGSPMLGRKIQNADGLPPGVLRLPRGPDGTRGFHSGSMEQRCKAVAPQTPAV